MAAASSPSATAQEEDHDQVLNGIRDLLLASDRARHHMASTFGLTVTDLAALSHLGSCENLGQRQLAQRLGLTASATTALIDRLERMDLARRAPHPSDRRRILINLTPVGRERITSVRTLYNTALTALSDAELAIATRVLQHLSSELEHLLNHGPAGN